MIAVVAHLDDFDRLADDSSEWRWSGQQGRGRDLVVSLEHLVEAVARAVGVEGEHALVGSALVTEPEHRNALVLVEAL